MQPAIEIARDGFLVDQIFFGQIQGNVDFFDDIMSTRALYLDPDGTPRDVGTTFRNPDMARTYERIVHLGAKGFYRGAVADAMVNAVQSPPLTPTANHVWRPGVMKMRDLHTYVAPERTPTKVSYRGLDVFGMGPPSSGGSTDGEALNILEGFTLSPPTARARSTSSSRRPASRSPTAARSSPTRTSSSTADWAPVRLLRRRATCADQPDAGDAEPRRAR